MEAVGMIFNFESAAFFAVLVMLLIGVQLPVNSLFGRMKFGRMKLLSGVG